MSLCSDGIDNDGDGFIDCEDGDCEQICVAELMGECITLDFETVAGNNTIDETIISNQFLGAGVSFSLSNGDFPQIAEYGSPGQAFSGFGADGPDPDYEGELAQFFLTDDGLPGGLSDITLILNFQIPVSIVTGQILDIDNTETFTFSAFDENGILLSQNSIDQSSPNTGNGLPTTWEIEAGGSCIWEVHLHGESSGGISFGYGLDNLSFCYQDPDQLCECYSDANPSDWLASVCGGCTDPWACNFDSESISDDGSCIYPDGCTDSSACNFDSEALCDDGTCYYPDGCTDPEACNFNPLFICDDGSCFYPDGCTDESACNFDSEAVCDDGSCILPDGCTDPGACNYDSTALCNDFSCDYSCLGCTDPEACNFDPEVTVDNGSCNYPGCNIPSACNYDPEAGCDDGSCILPDGCTNAYACNYDSTALCNDESCDFITCADCFGVPFGEGILDTCGYCFFPDDPLFNLNCAGDVYVPNAFSPNQDGLNEAFQIYTTREFIFFEMQIFNRWNERIYFSEDPEEAWNGSVNGGEYYANDGMYFYILRYAYTDAIVREKFGHVVIVR